MRWLRRHCNFFFSFFFAILFPSFSLFLSLSSALVEHSHHVKVEIYVTSIHIHLGLFLPLWWSWKFASWSLWKRSLQPARATIDMFMKRFALVLWCYYFIFGFCSFFCKILCFLFRYLSLTESFSMLNKFEVWKLYLSPLQYLLSPNGFLIYIYAKSTLYLLSLSVSRWHLFFLIFCNPKKSLPFITDFGMIIVLKRFEKSQPLYNLISSLYLWGVCKPFILFIFIYLFFSC